MTHPCNKISATSNHPPLLRDRLTNGLVPWSVQPDLVFSILSLPFSVLPWSNDSAFSNHCPLALSVLANFSSSTLTTIFVDSALVNHLVESNSTNGPPTDSESVGVLSATWSVSTVC